VSASRGTRRPSAYGLAPQEGWDKIVVLIGDDEFAPVEAAAPLAKDHWARPVELDREHGQQEERCQYDYRRTGDHNIDEPLGEALAAVQGLALEKYCLKLRPSRWRRIERTLWSGNSLTARGEARRS